MAFHSTSILRRAGIRLGQSAASSLGSTNLSDDGVTHFTRGNFANTLFTVAEYISGSQTGPQR